MAHLLLTIEPDPLVRAEFARQALRRFSRKPGLQVRSLAIGDCLVCWACRPHIPADSTLGPTSGALLLGYALDDDGRRLSAVDYLKEWSPAEAALSAHDGYFAGVRYDAQRGLSVEVDPWGLFPLYYTRLGSTLVAGSSADFFHCHPRFVERVDVTGLADILLTNGLVGQRTLIQNVVRLAAGSCLLSTPDRITREVETFRLQSDPPPVNWSQHEVVADTLDAFDQACARHVPPGRQTTVMLSGGLDSRLMAGFARPFDPHVTGTTFGLPTDFEVRAAEQVAGALQIPWRLHVDPAIPADLPALARTQAREQHLSGGFSNLEFGTHCQGPDSLPPWFWSGFFLDDLLGGCGAWYGYHPQTARWSSEWFLEKLQRWAMSPGSCRKLLNLPMDDAAAIVHDCQQRFYTGWNRLPGNPAQQSLMYKIQTRVRHHIGAAVHKLSFSSWPLLPALDRKFVDFILRIPPDATRHRRLENRLLQARSPQLADIPLDDNSFHYAPVDLGTPVGFPLMSRLAASGRKRWNAFYWNVWRRTEPRRYFRTYDLNGPFWRAVRRSAEPFRNHLDPCLVPAEVARLIPPPDRDIHLKDRFGDGASIRTLLGFMLWSDGEAASTPRAA